MRSVFAAAFASALVLRAYATPGLTLTVTPITSSEGNRLPVTTTVTNTGSETLTLLNDPRTILSDAPTETFAITNANGSPDFIGIRVKYSPEYVARENDPTSFTVLAPGHSREVVHDLAGVYNFTRTGAGDYRIEALDTFEYIDATGKLASLKAVTESSTFTLTENLIPSGTSRSRSRMVGTRQSGLRFNHCDESQKKEITEAAASAETSITEVLSWFNTHPTVTPRYKSWFGEYESARFNQVKEHFGKIQGKSPQTAYDCSCNMPHVFAYVYANQPGLVHICPAFWDAPMTGTDSKSGTLIHEQTHFDVNGGTRDSAYGHRNCRNLAINKPHLAAKNADNHEYFAENNPWEA
ncbi:hypothetical protein OPQ81_002628 [Rhizoctonia solani]|nr:hypothetical protein OPQ81_002628 [Rhizoctonia solani]